MTLTPEEGRRLHVLTLLEGKRISLGQAAEALGLTPRQVRRLRVGLRRDGPAALMHGKRGQHASHRLPPALQTQIGALARGRYAGLNDGHLTERLTSVESLAVSRATVQRVLRAAGCVSPRRRRPPRHWSRRPRRAQAGLRLQLDGSPDAWLGPAQPPWSLLGAIDDATGAVLAATFRAQEDAAGSPHPSAHPGTPRGAPGRGLDGCPPGLFVRQDAHWTLAEERQGFQDPPQVGPGPPGAGDAPYRRHEPAGQGPDRAPVDHVPGSPRRRAPPRGDHDAGRRRPLPRPHVPAGLHHAVRRATGRGRPCVPTGLPRGRSHAPLRLPLCAAGRPRQHGAGGGGGAPPRPRPPPPELCPRAGRCRAVSRWVLAGLCRGPPRCQHPGPARSRATARSEAPVSPPHPARPTEWRGVGGDIFPEHRQPPIRRPPTRRRSRGPPPFPWGAGF